MDAKQPQVRVRPAQQPSTASYSVETFTQTIGELYLLSRSAMKRAESAEQQVGYLDTQLQGATRRIEELESQAAAQPEPSADQIRADVEVAEVANNEKSPA